MVSEYWLDFEPKSCQILKKKEEFWHSHSYGLISDIFEKQSWALKSLKRLKTFYQYDYTVIMNKEILTLIFLLNRRMCGSFCCF